MSYCNHMEKIKKSIAEIIKQQTQYKFTTVILGYFWNNNTRPHLAYK